MSSNQVSIIDEAIVNDEPRTVKIPIEGDEPSSRARRSVLDEENLVNHPIFSNPTSESRSRFF